MPCATGPVVDFAVEPGDSGRLRSGVKVQWWATSPLNKLAGLPVTGRRTGVAATGIPIAGASSPSLIRESPAAGSWQHRLARGVSAADVGSDVDICLVARACEPPGKGLVLGLLAEPGLDVAPGLGELGRGLALDDVVVKWCLYRPDSLIIASVFDCFFEWGDEGVLRVWAEVAAAVGGLGVERQLGGEGGEVFARGESLGHSPRLWLLGEQDVASPAARSRVGACGLKLYVGLLVGVGNHQDDVRVSGLSSALGQRRRRRHG